ncbi:hypothetical protein E1B28_006723 [Marasmius oreades]|uniref:Myb-like domain-containing protein n=1 Tax=Marasmius oreades TaxID=181124 RepID=A0A9P8AAF1_9AGAR|nr:uncharacterized protein E1B28_006723 [Marasmius oreades]KAG7096042.1 hypothetical protein E1B28_006723 [Marasmius oreades]
MCDNDKRAQTLQVLSEYITAQRLLLSKTQADIERLNELKNRFIELPSGFVENLSEELDSNAFRLSEQVQCFSEISKPKDIDWSVYQKHGSFYISFCFICSKGSEFSHFSHPDPTPFRSFTTFTSQPLQPSESYSSQPPNSSPFHHPLRDYVRTARTTILDPVFTKFNLSYNPEPEIELEPERNETDGNSGSKTKTREQEHKKIRDLKRRKIVCGGLTVNVSSSTSTSHGGSDGGRAVYVRRDIQDESMEVDVDVDAHEPELMEKVAKSVPTEMKKKTKPIPLRQRERRIVVPPLPMVLTKTPRTRRPSKKASMDEDREQERDEPPPKGPTIVIPALRHPRRTRVPSTSTESSSMTPPVLSSTRSRSHSHSRSQSPSSSLATSPEPEMEVSDNDVDENNNDVRGGFAVAMGLEGKTKKPRPETYKQAWSISEQHLLERLLDEIPDGSKNRWKQISLSMGGQRTPRQVASRVQKYFEKLRKYDAFDVDGV